MSWNFITGIPYDIEPVAASANHIGSDIIGFIVEPTGATTAGVLGITTLAGQERNHPFAVNQPYAMRLTHIRTIPADMTVHVYRVKGY